jgi:hypothetical protein
LSISGDEEVVEVHSPPPPLAPLPPPLELDAKAADAFSDTFFSPRPELERHKALGTKTVSDVLIECWRSDDLQYAQLAVSTGTAHEALRQFFRQPFERSLSLLGRPCGTGRRWTPRATCKAWSRDEFFLNLLSEDVNEADPSSSGRARSTILRNESIQQNHLQ